MGGKNISIFGDEGFIPPQSLDLEQAVLGACLLESRALNDVCSIITSECFYTEANMLIFDAIINLKNHKKRIDLLTVSNYLKDSGNLEAVGGVYYLSQLTMKISSAAHVTDHAKAVYEKYVKREFIRIGVELQRNAYSDGDVVDISTTVQDEMLKLMRVSTSNISTIDDAIEKVYKTIDANLQEKTGLTGIGTGLSQFDHFTGGLQKTDLVIVAAETSQGKTSLALSMINSAVIKFGAKVAFYSLEMTEEQLAKRMLSQIGKVNSKDISLRKLEHWQIQNIDMAAGTLHQKKIFFDDSSTSRIDNLLSSIRMLKIKQDIDIVVVDYLQLVTSNLKGGTKEQQVADVARSLKNIAKELNICVLLLSQLSRSENPYPSLNRLRDSGQIEEAADMVIFVYRPEHYKKEYPYPFESYPTEDTALIDIAKGRNTGTYQFIVSFERHFTLFSDFTGEMITPKAKPF